MKQLFKFFMIVNLLIASSSFAQGQELVFNKIQSLKVDNDQNSGFTILTIKGFDADGAIQEYGSVSDREVMEACKSFAVLVMKESENFNLRVYKDDEYFCELISIK